VIRRNPQRLAWSVLLLSFGMCVALAVSLPLAVRSFLTDSTDPTPRILEAQGTVLLRRPTSTDFAGITDFTVDVPDGSIIKTDQSTQAILTLRDPASDTNLTIVQMYGSTELTVLSAASPRFGSSPNPHRLDLNIESGRIRVNIPADSSRPVAASVRAPQGEVAFSTGTYAVEVSNQELQVTAREGTATVEAQGTQVVIESLQRARVELGQAPQGGLSNERNLIVDGNFAGIPFGAWSVGNDLQNADEAPGLVVFRTVSGRRAAQFDRAGRSHAETRLVQSVDRDIRDAASLTLHIAGLISQQDIPVCGSLGSECPLMVRINYLDTVGSVREWVQGFYYLPDTNPIDPNNPNPTACATCSTRNEHRLVTQNSWFTYDSPNLMDLLTIEAFSPARITEVTIYASGHSYRSAVTDVELLVQD
jgi:hypothetical protein